MPRWILLCVTLAACGGAAVEPAPVAEPAEAPPAPPEAPAAAPEAPAAAPVMQLVAVQAGDTACSLTIQSGDQEAFYAAYFAGCAGGGPHPTPHIGKNVALTLGKAKVMAASCQGNPDCTDSEEVDLVTALVVAP